MKLRPLIISFSLAAILLLGLALWYFQPHTAPAAAPFAQTKAAVAPAPVTASENLPAEQGSTPAVARPSPTAPESRPQMAVSSAPAPQPQPVLQSLGAGGTPDPKAQIQNEETAATARMYAAHASLRTPEVADPDSKANKEILQTMVFKALAQGSSQPLPQTEPKDSGLRTNTGPAAAGNGAQRASR